MFWIKFDSGHFLPFKSIINCCFFFFLYSLYQFIRPNRGFVFNMAFVIIWHCDGEAYPVFCGRVINSCPTPLVLFFEDILFLGQKSSVYCQFGIIRAWLRSAAVVPFELFRFPANHFIKVSELGFRVLLNAPNKKYRYIFCVAVLICALAQEICQITHSHGSGSKLFWT